MYHRKWTWSWFAADNQHLKISMCHNWLEIEKLCVHSYLTYGISIWLWALCKQVPHKLTWLIHLESVSCAMHSYGHMQQGPTSTGKPTSKEGSDNDTSSTNFFILYIALCYYSRWKILLWKPKCSATFGLLNLLIINILSNLYNKWM